MINEISNGIQFSMNAKKSFMSKERNINYSFYLHAEGVFKVFIFSSCTFYFHYHTLSLKKTQTSIKMQKLFILAFNMIWFFEYKERLLDTAR